MIEALWWIHLDTFVSLRVLELRRMTPGRRALQCDWDISQARAHLDLMLERCDLLLGSPQIGASRTRQDTEHSALIMHQLTYGLAALAISAPGGIWLAGRHWCADPPNVCCAANST